ncbi:luciferase family protein [Paenibacillus thailandensis]|uniref:Luciferase family protein n=1 Tax=Paenibacillus thailandensis TaxID=393250 RepID=A0ABW5QXZ2_9BACL
MSLSARELLSESLLSHPGVSRQPHRFGGIEFVYEGKEIGHVHGDHLVDILFPKPVRDELVASGRAQPHHMFPESGWVSVYIKSGDDAASAIEMLKLKYDLMASKQR